MSLRIQHLDVATGKLTASRRLHPAVSILLSWYCTVKNDLIVQNLKVCSKLLRKGASPTFNIVGILGTKQLHCFF